MDWPEDTPGEKELYVLNVTDENLDSVHIYSMTNVDPADASTMFSLDSRSKYDLRYSNLPNTVASYFLMLPLNLQTLHFKSVENLFF